MALGVKVLICLSWFVYLANTDMFKASHQVALDDIILQTSTRDKVTCSGLCTKMDGCNSFSFTKADRHCKLARHATYDSASTEVIYIREMPEQAVRFVLSIGLI